MEQTDLIVCRDLSLGYEGQSVLSHLNLRVRSGDYLCLVGNNGSGKSTLLRGLLGLLPPLSGTIERAAELERGAVGYLPQQTRAQRDFPATVEEVVLSGCLNQKGLRFFYTAAQRSRALMNMGKLPGATGTSPGASSSGSCWPGPSAPQAACSSWTSPSPAWTPPPPRTFTRR